MSPEDLAISKWQTIEIIISANTCSSSSSSSNLLEIFIQGPRGDLSPRWRWKSFRIHISLGNIDRVPCTFYTKTSQYSDLVREYVADDYETLDNDGISQGAVEIREILAASCRDVC